MNSPELPSNSGQIKDTRPELLNLPSSPTIRLALNGLNTPVSTYKPDPHFKIGTRIKSWTCGLCRADMEGRFQEEEIAHPLWLKVTQASRCVLA